MRSWDVQEGVYNVLSQHAGLASLVEGVYDHVPQDAEFPFVVIGEDVAEAFDIDDRLDSDHLVTIHAWSRYRGLREVKLVQQQIYAALHRKSIAINGAVLVDCSAESQETFLESDGLTRHGVQTFRILLDEIEE